MHALAQLDPSHLPSIGIDQAAAWLADPDQIDLADVCTGLRRGLAYIEVASFVIGVALLAIKAKTPHGQWFEVVSDAAPTLPKRTAQLYMKRATTIIQLNQQFPAKSASLAFLPPAHIDILCRLPRKQRTELMSTRGDKIAGIAPDEIASTPVAAFAERLGITEKRKAKQATAKAPPPRKWIQLVGLMHDCTPVEIDQAFAFLLTEGNTLNTPASLYEVVKRNG